LGYDKDNIIWFYREGKLSEEEHLETFLAELSNMPGIVSASSIGHDLTGHNWGVYGFDWEGKDPNDNTTFENVAVNYDMMETLGFETVAGRTYSRNFSSEGAKIIFNEAAIEHMKLEDHIGKTFTFWGDNKQIIGVVKDFHFESLHEAVKPLFFRLNPHQTLSVVAKVTSGTEQKTIEQLEKFYKAYNPGFSLDYRFLDQQFQSLYIAEQRVATLSEYFAVLAIIISCLGLFGLAAFTAERRLKEIGIRKILGSSDFGIVRLLSADFTKMVLMAILIALPISYFITKNWLDDFAYRIELEWWFFVGAGFIALLIAWFTVGLQTVKAASVHPTQCLKDE
jgi:predicted lysophospholipase L1 biosynthesis ABC-type transport system permease subunit